jgi:hypothetical protein
MLLLEIVGLSFEIFYFLYFIHCEFFFLAPYGVRAGAKKVGKKPKYKNKPIPDDA